MDRLFFDANVLFSAAYRPNNGILALWKRKNVVLCSSQYALQEAHINLDDAAQQNRLARLANHLEFFEVAASTLPSGVALPDKDVPILLAAIAARATHLLTGDLRHFGPYFGKKFAGILVLPPAAYLHP
ncbi:MAG TPA: PIN domain-containing protein [Candidatus Sulfotelmatobacter sp.]|nr:PIN domain-containing protein [Candidatus Sulfotelmatobacter sp.]